MPLQWWCTGTFGKVSPISEEFLCVASVIFSCAFLKLKVIRRVCICKYHKIKNAYLLKHIKTISKKNISVIAKVIQHFGKPSSSLKMAMVPKDTWSDVNLLWRVHFFWSLRRPWRFEPPSFLLQMENAFLRHGSEDVLQLDWKITPASHRCFLLSSVSLLKPFI